MQAGIVTPAVGERFPGDVLGVGADVEIPLGAATLIAGQDETGEQGHGVTAGVQLRTWSGLRATTSLSMPWRYQPGVPLPATVS